MPIHVYECPNGHNTDDLVRISDRPLETIKCACCGEPAKRIVSAFGLKVQDMEIHRQHLDWCKGDGPRQFGEQNDRMSERTEKAQKSFRDHMKHNQFKFDALTSNSLGSISTKKTKAKKGKAA